VPPDRKKLFRTRPIIGVRPTLSSVDNIAEIIALAEGE